MARDFVFSRDITKVLWKETFIVNLLRSAFAGVIWAVVLLFTENAADSLSMLAFPLAYFLVFVPIGLVAAWFARDGSAYAGLVVAVIAFFVAVGDPFVYFIRLKMPSIVPIKKGFNFFNFRILIFVLEEEEENEDKEGDPINN